jgi:uncharacterized protein YjbJ (UPF0337 family)
MTNVDTLKGQLKQTEGEIQQSIGKQTGSVEDQLAGQAKQVSGKVVETIGRAKDAIKQKLDDEDV